MHECSAVCHRRLSIDGSQVVVHRVPADTETPGDLRVSQSLGEEKGHLRLPAGEAHFAQPLGQGKGRFLGVQEDQEVGPGATPDHLKMNGHLVTGAGN